MQPQLCPGPVLAETPLHTLREKHPALFASGTFSVVILVTCAALVFQMVFLQTPRRLLKMRVTQVSAPAVEKGTVGEPNAEQSLFRS